MEGELRASQRHPKPKLHTTALAEAVRAVQKQQPEATRFPIRQLRDPALGPWAIRGWEGIGHIAQDPEHQPGQTRAPARSPYYKNFEAKPTYQFAFFFRGRHFPMSGGDPRPSRPDLKCGIDSSGRYLSARKVSHLSLRIFSSGSARQVSDATNFEHELFEGPIGRRIFRKLVRTASRP